jgi:hypothetical protein
MSNDLTKEDVKEIVEDVMDRFASVTLPEIMREAMAHKIEFTFGVDCKDPIKRDALRDDLKFVHRLRQRTHAGGEKLFIVAVGVFGTGFIYWFVSKVWPEGQKFLPH